MHSDPIARHPELESTSAADAGHRGAPGAEVSPGRRRPRAALPALIAMVAIVVLLAGCNTGTMTEARRSQQHDEAEGARLSAQQATRTAETFFSATATPSPAAPLPPTLESLVVTLGVGPDGAPSGSYLSVPTDAGVVYASGLLRNIRPGQVVSAAWTDAFGNVYGTFEVEFTADAASQWVTVPMQVGGATSGEYAVYFYGAGHQLGSLAFTVSGAGSGAQLLPDLPANPQAQATGVPRQSSSEEVQAEETNQESEGDRQQEEGTWQQDQQQDQWNQPQQQDQWNQPAQDQWNQGG